MSDKIFVDTNILVYAHNRDAEQKYRIASRHISQLWDSRLGVMSTQVLKEFYITLTRKNPKPASKSTARSIIQSYLTWEVVVNNPKIILHASEIEENCMISFWDALIVSAAFSANADIILTEDLNHGQTIEGVTIQNPFIGQ